MKKEKLITALGIVLFVCFLGMMFCGYFSDEANVVLAKARNICMECIGIG